MDVLYFSMKPFMYIGQGSSCELFTVSSSETRRPRETHLRLTGLVSLLSEQETTTNKGSSPPASANWLRTQSAVVRMLMRTRGQAVLITLSSQEEFSLFSREKGVWWFGTWSSGWGQWFGEWSALRKLLNVFLSHFVQSQRAENEM